MIPKLLYYLLQIDIGLTRLFDPTKVPQVMSTVLIWVFPPYKNDNVAFLLAPKGLFLLNKLEKVFELYALVGILSVSKLYQNDRIFGLTRTEILKKFGLVFVRFVD